MPPLRVPTKVCNGLIGRPDSSNGLLERVSRKMACNDRTVYQVEHAAQLIEIYSETAWRCRQTISNILQSQLYWDDPRAP